VAKSSSRMLLAEMMLKSQRSAEDKPTIFGHCA
jgi:hypothetical protein